MPYFIGRGYLTAVMRAAALLPALNIGLCGDIPSINMTIAHLSTEELSRYSLPGGTTEVGDGIEEEVLSLR